MTALALFAPCPRGLESVLATELAAIGATAARETPGGVHFAGDQQALYRANLESRIASRILRRIAQGPYRNEGELYELARAVPWHDWFTVERTIRVDVTAIRSPLRSLEFATLRVKDAVCDRFRDEIGRRPNVDTRVPDVRISVFLDAAEASIYLDTSGEPLFKRGYRGETGEAPLRENLAAGVLALSGWQPEEPLLDPMCGSGTFMVEALQRAMRVAPGARRSFGFERLLDLDAALWKRVRDEARRAERDARGLTIHGSDRSARAIAAARATLDAAGLADRVQLRQVDVLDRTAPAASGVIVSNPPYGVRLGEAQALAAWYPKLGDVLKQRFSGWRCYLLSAQLDLQGRLRLRASRRTPLFNGAIECRLFEFRMVSGSLRARGGDRPDADPG